MKLLFFILIILLIAQIGFWNALGAVLGAVLMLILLIALAIGVLVVGAIVLMTASVR